MKKEAVAATCGFQYQRQECNEKEQKERSRPRILGVFTQAAGRVQALTPTSQRVHNRLEHGVERLQGCGGVSSVANGSGGVSRMVSKIGWPHGMVDAFDSTNKVSTDNAETIQLW